MNMKNWLVRHNFMEDEEYRRLSEEAFNAPDPGAWDKYWSTVRRTAAVKWWVDLKPDLNWKPFEVSGDEYMREVYAVRIPFGPALMVANNKKTCRISEEDKNAFVATFLTRTMSTGLNRSEEFDGSRGIEVDFNEEGEVCWIDIDKAVLEANFKK